ncbi:hypothetical protein RSSM_02208 [Rhodopirellula sallentina SM41]|uniref:Uncharacterized protein n=1 Tax=Rhodopirellula sallentina SM41 TaxID=1263870 RepID=M5UJY5_9BACT|nr:hypothetical protein RSSM_02208 [Rhodopirellula sallentina SM41]
MFDVVEPRVGRTAWLLVPLRRSYRTYSCFAVALLLLRSDRSICCFAGPGEGSVINLAAE